MTCEIYEEGHHLLKPDTKRLAIKPTDRSGLKSVHYFDQVKIEGVLTHFLNLVKDEQNFFVLPDSIKAVAPIYPFLGIKEVISVLIDAGRLIQKKLPLIIPRSLTK